MEYFSCDYCSFKTTEMKELMHHAETCAWGSIYTPEAKITITMGTKHDGSKAPLSMLPPAGLEGAARVFEFGARKYGTYNFMGGFAYTRLTSAALRHLFAWIWGQDSDPESGQSHLHHALCCLLMLCQIIEVGTGTDDRYKPSPKT